MTGPAWLILPTYNEAENLEAIVRAALPVLAAAAPAGCKVLIVDDGSPDGTGAIADRLAAEDPEHVAVIHRSSKDGLGRAYLAGFRAALEGRAELVLEMDSDFSHDPVDIARLIAASEGAGMVLGSRYVPGGGVRDWGLLRRGLSRGGCLYAQAVLGLRVRDLTGGFKCIRREVLEAIDFEHVGSEGYSFQVEMTYRALRAGFRVVEVPIVFRDRERGTSKMSARIAAEAIWRVPMLRWRLRRRRGRRIG